MPGWRCAASCARSWSGSGPVRSACSRSSTARSRCVPGALPEPHEVRGVGEQPPRGVPRAPALLRWSEAHRAALEAQTRARGTRWRGRARRPAGARARSGHRDQATGRADQAAHRADRHRPARALDGEIFRSLFRDPRSVVTAAEPLAEIGDCRARYPTRDTLAADASQAAVAVESGRKTASFRWGCNKRLRGAFCTLADSIRHWHPWAQDRYAAARARGHQHHARTHPRSRLLPDRLALLARPHPLRPSQTPRLATTLHGHSSDVVGLPARPRRHRADARRRRQPTWRPAGPSATRLTASRHPLFRSEVDTGRLPLLSTGLDTSSHSLGTRKPSTRRSAC
jgi:hypothetical protein